LSCCIVVAFERFIKSKSSHKSFDLRHLSVYWLPHIVKRGRPENDSRRPSHAGQREHPQEEAVHDHRDVLPVLNYLISEHRDRRESERERERDEEGKDRVKRKNREEKGSDN
jgi:hypothetical protein